MSFKDELEVRSFSFWILSWTVMFNRMRLGDDTEDIMT